MSVSNEHKAIAGSNHCCLHDREEHTEREGGREREREMYRQTDTHTGEIKERTLCSIKCKHKPESKGKKKMAVPSKV